MFQLVDRVRTSILTMGTASPITLGPAVLGFRTLVEAGAVEDRPLPYLIEDGFKYEIGSSLYTIAGTLVTRDVKVSSDGVGVRLNLTAAAQYFITPMVDTLLGRQTIGAPAYAMTAVDSVTPLELREETATNANMILGWRFSSGVDQAVQFDAPMPTSWDLAPLIARFRARAPVAIAGTCRFQIRAVAMKDDTPSDVAFGTPVFVDTVVKPNAGNGFFTAETPPLTVGNSPAHPCDVKFEIARLGSAEASGPAGAVDLLSTRVYYQTNTVTDSP